jgi:hypothetical protein
MRPIQSALKHPAIIVTASLAALAATIAAQVAPANAQTGDAQISAIDCSGDPEIVTILNGDAPTDLTGWSLVSDPVAEESFDLTIAGQLAAGVSINVQSGPGASGSLVWSQEEVLRDDDPADFARLLDDTGATVDEVACAEATPTPTPPPGDVPNGGGPLAPSSEPLTILLTGASLSAAAGVLLVLALAPIAALRNLIPGRRRKSEQERGVEMMGRPRTAWAPGTVMFIGLAMGLLLLLVTVAIGGRHRQ